MLDGIRVFTKDELWRRILGELGAVVSDVQSGTDIDFDAINLANAPISAVEIKAVLLSAQGNDKILKQIFGRPVALPGVQARIVVALAKSGGMRGADLKEALGYSRDAATHTIDTAIYQLRRTYGRDFIQNDRGVYRIGKI